MYLVFIHDYHRTVPTTGSGPSGIWMIHGTYFSRVQDLSYGPTSRSQEHRKHSEQLGAPSSPQRASVDFQAPLAFMPSCLPLLSSIPLSLFFFLFCNLGSSYFLIFLCDIYSPVVCSLTLEKLHLIESELSPLIALQREQPTLVK